MKTAIIKDEAYPVFFLEHDEEYIGLGREIHETDVDIARLRRWRKVLSEYEDVQKEMQSVFNKKEKRKET